MNRIYCVLFGLNQDAHEKRHYKFGYLTVNITFSSQLHAIFYHRNSCLICLKMDICGVWIPVCVSMKYLRIWIIKSASKNWSKMGFVAVDLTEVSSLTELEDVTRNWKLCINSFKTAQM